MANPSNKEETTNPPMSPTLMSRAYASQNARVKIKEGDKQFRARKVGLDLILDKKVTKAREVEEATEKLRSLEAQQETLDQTAAMGEAEGKEAPKIREYTTSKVVTKAKVFIKKARSLSFVSAPAGCYWRAYGWPQN